MSVVLGWICAACSHRNPPLRMKCRQCRTDRPLGSVR